MYSGSNPQSEDQFLCSICLDVFTDPVSTPCGHNFCKTCITQHWTGNIPYKCPMCNEPFTSLPQLRVNTFIREMVSQFRRKSQHEAGSESEQQAPQPKEVPCDFCTGTKLKAVKSCLVCQASYCQTHLEPHLTNLRLKRHKLSEPVENLEDRMCPEHDKPLEMFCRTDQTCVCSDCVADHKKHKLVPLKEEAEGKKGELRKTEAEVQKMIQERRLKIQEMKASVMISKDAADKEKEEGVQIFTALKEAAERGLKEFIKEIEEKQKSVEKQAEDFIRDLDQEISELTKRSSEVKQLSKSEDHLHLVQSFSSLKAALTTKTWTEVRVHPPSYEGAVVRAVAQLVAKIRKTMKEMKDAEMKRVQQYAVDVTLDPNTANPWLILSDDRKQVKHGDVYNKLPDNPERFSFGVCVLGKQGFFSGRFYFEVEVKGKTDWTLGVVRESVNRKGEIIASPQNGYWTIRLKSRNEYFANAATQVRLHLHPVPEKVGVFVDYEEGLVSFHDVDAGAPIYSFTGCCFTQKLYPYFNPSLNQRGRNSSPLIICPVNDR